jgi:hypothetical protein
MASRSTKNSKKLPSDEVCKFRATEPPVETTEEVTLDDTGDGGEPVVVVVACRCGNNTFFTM